jgi:hypothetical protein
MRVYAGCAAYQSNNGCGHAVASEEENVAAKVKLMTLGVKQNGRRFFSGINSEDVTLRSGLLPRKCGTEFAAHGWGKKKAPQAGPIN